MRVCKCVFVSCLRVRSVATLHLPSVSRDDQMCGVVKLTPGLEFGTNWTGGVVSSFCAQGREHWAGHPMAFLPSSTSLVLGERDSL